MIWGLIVFVIFGVVVVGSSFYFRLSKGGPGPAINGWVPKALHQPISNFYVKHGWQRPWNFDGSRNTDRDPF